MQARERDLHSGLYGSAARNPIHVLARILADLHDGDGRVADPRLLRWRRRARRRASRRSGRRSHFDERRFLAEIGLSMPAGERGRRRARADLVAADLRRERHRRRLYRRGLQDRDPRESVGQGVVPPGRRSGPGQGRRRPSAPSCARACRLNCKATFLSPWRRARRCSQPIDAPPREDAARALADEWRRPAVLIGLGRLDPDRRAVQARCSGWIRSSSASASTTTASIRRTRSTT